jgi:protein-disulfide isomerase
MKRILDASLTIVVLVAAGLVIWRQFMPVQPFNAPPRVETASGTLPADSTVHSRGSGPVALIEVADFQCPFCGRHAREVEPDIRKAFVEAGVVREVFINYPLPNHQFARGASEAAICAGSQNQFWEMRDALFQDQSKLESEDLASHARQLGLDVARFTDCVGGREVRRALEQDMKIAKTLGVQATPAFFVGLVQSDGSVLLKKRLNGAFPFSDFRTAINGVVPRALQKQVRNLAGLLVLPRLTTTSKGGV